MVGTKNILFNYLLVFLLIGLSTFPFFKDSFGLYLMCGACLLVMKGVLHFTLSLRFMLFLFILEIYHFCYFYPDYKLVDIRQEVISYLVGLIVIVQLKYRFLPTYLRIMYILTIISIPVYILFLISPSLVNSFANAMPDFFKLKFKVYGQERININPIFYNFNVNLFDEKRNNGPFWEPTVFAALLCIGLIFNYLEYKTILNKYGLVFIIGLLSTLSTTGYLAFFILILPFFILSTKIKLIVKILVLTLAIFSGIFLYKTIPFLGVKITDEYENAGAEAYELGGNSRMASAYLDWMEVTEKPIYFILGKGVDPTNRIKGKDKNVLRNNGFTSLLIEKGVIFLILYVSLLYFTFYWLCKQYGINTYFSFFWVLMIIELSFSEGFFDLPLFHAFNFIGLVLYEINKKQIPIRRDAPLSLLKYNTITK